MDSTPVKEGPFIERITLEDIDVTEERDAKIEDRDEFFRNFEIFKVTLPDGKILHFSVLICQHLAISYPLRIIRNSCTRPGLKALFSTRLQALKVSHIVSRF